MKKFGLRLVLPGLTAVLACSGSPPVRVEDHVREIEAWRANRLERLQGETGWLTLAGLHWLEEGENRFGTDPSNDIILPEGTAPDFAGSFFLESARVRVKAAAGADISLEGEPVEEREIHTDESGEPDLLRIDDLYMYALVRGDRFGIRVMDPNSSVRTDFPGLDYFPVEYSYRFEAEFIPYDPPRQIPIADVLGMVNDRMVPGVARFTRNGQTMSLIPVINGPEDRHFFFIFADPTNGKETYGAGRYLYADLEEDGTLIVDFNKAYNPPCAFNPFATCPLPPPRNFLATRVEAGEKSHAHH